MVTVGTPKGNPKDRYILKSVQSAADVLAVFEPGEILGLSQVVSRSGFNKGKTFRLLYTLERCGFLEKTGNNKYRSVMRPKPRRKYRIGYASPGEDYLFSEDVLESLLNAADAESIDLIHIDNRYDSKTAVHNADLLIREGVDLAMEFQTDEHVAPVISAKYCEAGIPVIAIEIPHPGATFYGANNYEAGQIGGRYLARWARHTWSGEIDEILMIGLPKAGALPASRITGMKTAIKESLRLNDHVPVVHLNGNGQFGVSMEAVRKHLHRTNARRILVGAINDPSALGALRAFEEAGRANHCAVMGQNASPEARSEIRKPGTRLIGSVAYFPERFGNDLIPLAVNILHRMHVPPAVFIKHRLIDAANIDRFYANDSLRAIAAGEQ